MLGLLKQQPTILDFVREWWGAICTCGQDIDVCWLPDAMDHDGQWEDSAWFATHCPECVSAAAPEDLRPSLRKRYERLRRDRLAVGLGSVVPDSPRGGIDPDHSARRSLNWHSGPITLNAGAWRRPRKTGPNDLVMEQLVIMGTIAEAQRSQLDPEAIAPLPWFDLQVLEPPDHPGEQVELARVLLGATVRSPERPGLEWRYTWNKSIPASYGFFSLPPYWQEWTYSPHEMGTFVGRAMDLFRRHEKGGRPSVDSDCEWYIDEAARYMIEHQGTAPTKSEFVEFTGRPESTMRGHLQDCGLWPWMAFKQQAFPSRSTSRD
jgi:hypothetical protein